MNKELKTALEKLISSPGQGSILEQLDKIVRKLQRIELYNLLEQVDEEEIENFPVILYKSHPQSGKQNPMLLRFFVKNWMGYDDVFWQALGDYIIVALHRVKDVEYDSARGKIKVQYFAKEKGESNLPKTSEGLFRSLPSWWRMKTCPQTSPVSGG